MDVLTSLGILVFSMLILAFLQLTPGIFALFSHYASGKYSKKKASDLSLFFIFGVETMTTFIFLLIYIIFNIFYSFFSNINLLIWVLCGIFFAFGIISLFFYFRNEPGTKLFIPRSLAKNFDQKAFIAKNRSDAFLLGLISTVPELIFTLPLYIFSTLIITSFDATSIMRALLIILFTLSSITPLLIIHSRTNHNLADYLKFRFKNKNFFRIFISISYFILAILIVAKATS